MKKYLWQHENLPAPAIVDERDIGTNISLEELGYLSDDTLYCSKYDCKELPLAER